MDPWRRRRGFMDDFFSDFDEDFMRMQEHMARVFNEAKKPSDQSKNYVYGFNMRLGPDGKPQISEFGDMPSASHNILGGREPLVDVLDGDDEIKAVIELPGVEKEDINVYVEEEKVVIDTSDEKRRFHKEIPLMDEVVPESSKATYKNGILEITLKKVKERQEQKKKINVE